MKEKNTHRKMIRMQHGCPKINHKILQLVSLGFLIICALIAVYGWKLGMFHSISGVQGFIHQYGRWGIVIFTMIQIVQVVIPILPGGIGCLGGVILFGAWKGFLCNYIGICIGSFGAFGIAKYFGKPILSNMFSEKMIQKYENWAEKENRFVKLFALAIFFPVAPDDFLCYLAGTTKMSWKQFVTIIILGKPLAIALYSMGLVTVFQRLLGW